MKAMKILLFAEALFWFYIRSYFVFDKTFII